MTMSNGSFMEFLAREVAVALAPLQAALDSADVFTAYMVDLGWDTTTIPPPVADLKPAVDAAISLAEREDFGAADLPALLSAITDFFTGVEGLRTIPAGDLPATIDPAEFASEFPDQLVQAIVVDHLLHHHADWGSLLKFFGVITLEDVGQAGSRPPYLKKSFAWDRLLTVPSDPLNALADHYRWGESEFRARTLVENVVDLVRAWGLPFRFAVPAPEIDTHLASNPINVQPEHDVVLRAVILEERYSSNEFELGVGLFLLPEIPSAKPGFAILPYGRGAVSDVFHLSEDLRVEVRGDMDLAAGVGFVFRPERAPEFIKDIIPSVSGGGLPPSSGSLAIALIGAQEEGEGRSVVLGSAGGSRLEVGTALLEAGARADSLTGHEVHLEAEMTDGRIVIQPGRDDADSFLRRLLPEDGLAFGFNLLMGVSSRDGFYLSGSGGLEVKLPVHLQIGPVEVVGATIAVPATVDELQVRIGGDVKGDLGPLTAVVDDVGFVARFTPRPDSSGNLGPLDLSFAFKPPTGVGLSVDGGGFRGGGFLSFEPALGRYAGTLELDFQDELTLNAIGLVTTPLPDGSDGFSLLIVITAEFTPIKLGLGFTLNGVGGLLGLNRTTKVDVLSAGIKTNALASVLFPQNILANAPRLISDLSQIFPPQAGRFVFGPMAKIGWGTPTLITIELGLIVEAPHPLRVFIPGVLRALLPDEQTGLIRIQVNFLGQWEEDRQRISFDASLYDSRVLTMPLAGDMAFRLTYGDNPVFLVSVGGFHPAFTPPPIGLPSLERITLNLVSGDNPRIVAAGYYAITSNTVQFGAKVEILAKAWKFNVYGFLAYDALFQFSPFSFAVAISGSVAVRSGSSVLFSIGLDLDLAGPAPWSINGTGSFRILFCKVKVRFSKTWGEERNTTLPDVAVLPKLLAALRQPENWEARLPARNHLLVSLRTIDDVGQDRLVIHPAGALTVAQKVVPLDTPIQRFGNQRPADARRFTIQHASANGSAFRKRPVEEYFAPAQFEDMDNAEKLSRRSFERLPAGVSLTSQDNDLQSSRVVARELRYETITIDTHLRRQAPGKVVGERLATFRPLLWGGALAKSRFSTAKRAEPPLGPGRIGVDPEGYSVVGTDDLRPFDGKSTYRSQAGATSYLRELVRANPALQGTIQVVPNGEVREAA
jgi:hypothetical protein